MSCDVIISLILSPSCQSSRSFIEIDNVQFCTKRQLSRDAREPVFGVSDQLSHKPACTVTEESYRPGISDLRRRAIVLSVERKQRR